MKSELLDIHQVYVAYQIAFIDVQGLVKWAQKSTELDSFADDPDVAQLICTKPDTVEQLSGAGTLFDQIYRRYWSPNGTVQLKESIAKQLLVLRLNEYILGDCDPYDLCREYPKLCV